MLRRLIGAVAVILAFAPAARAQVIPGDSPTTRIYWSGMGNNLSSEDRWREAESEQKYREAVKRIPDRKPSNDPWKKVRPASTTVADRHRVQ